MMDPLSEVLALLPPQTFVVGGFDLSGNWSIQFDPHSGIKCWAVVSGSCLLAVEGASEPIRLQAGDCVILPSGRFYRLTKKLSSVPIPFRKLRTIEWRGGMATLNGGGETMILGGHFVFAGPQANMLLGEMPSVVPIRDNEEKASLRWALDRMRKELAQPQPGASLVSQHLAHLVLVQALRLYLANTTEPRVGWLFGLADPQLAEAIGAIHADPSAPWTLPMLAKKAGMSRSTFAQKFKDIVGYSPVQYLTQWRMLLAGSRLKSGAEPVSAIALSLGYESEAAFSTAFRRVMGCSPRQYARSASIPSTPTLWGTVTLSASTEN